LYLLSTFSNTNFSRSTSNSSAYLFGQSRRFFTFPFSSDKSTSTEMHKHRSIIIMMFCIKQMITLLPSCDSDGEVLLIDITETTKWNIIMTGKTHYGPDKVMKDNILLSTNVLICVCYNYSPLTIMQSELCDLYIVHDYAARCLIWHIWYIMVLPSSRWIHILC
jgi:hypothetical protein